MVPEEYTQSDPENKDKNNSGVILGNPLDFTSFCMFIMDVTLS